MTVHPITRLQDLIQVMHRVAEVCTTPTIGSCIACGQLAATCQCPLAYLRVGLAEDWGEAALVPVSITADVTGWGFAPDDAEAVVTVKDAVHPHNDCNRANHLLYRFEDLPEEAGSRRPGDTLNVWAPMSQMRAFMAMVDGRRPKDEEPSTERES